jgi:hypothetical protein
MSVQPYALVAPGGSVLNIVNWDGVTAYSVSPNTLVSAQGQPNAQIGGTYLAGVFTAPAQPVAPQGIIFENSPVSGATVALPNAPQPQAKLYVILLPAATLAALTLDLPPSPVDGDTVQIFSSKAVTALTLTPPSGVLISNTPTSLTALVSVSVVYSAQYATWFHLS